MGVQTEEVETKGRECGYILAKRKGKDSIVNSSTSDEEDNG